MIDKFPRLSHSQYGGMPLLEDGSWKQRRHVSLFKKPRANKKVSPHFIPSHWNPAKLKKSALLATNTAF